MPGIRAKTSISTMHGFNAALFLAVIPRAQATTVGGQGCSPVQRSLLAAGRSLLRLTVVGDRRHSFSGGLLGFGTCRDGVRGGSTGREYGEGVPMFGDIGLELVPNRRCGVSRTRWLLARPTSRLADDTEPGRSECSSERGRVFVGNASESTLPESTTIRLGGTLFAL